MNDPQRAAIKARIAAQQAEEAWQAANPDLVSRLRRLARRHPVLAVILGLLAGVAIASLFSRPRRLARAGGRRAAGLAALGSELALAYAAQALAQTRDAGRTVRSTAQGLQRQASAALGEGADRIETIGRALRERLGKEAGGR